MIPNTWWYLIRPNDNSCFIPGKTQISSIKRWVPCRCYAESFLGPRPARVNHWFLSPPSRRISGFNQCSIGDTQDSDLKAKSRTGWWLGHPSEKYESQLGWLATQYMGKKNGNQTTNQILDEIQQPKCWYWFHALLILDVPMFSHFIHHLFLNPLMAFL